jgi:hypothetical protein
MFRRFLNIIRKKQIYVLFAIALIVIGALIIAFHHHDDGKMRDDCPICILQENGINVIIVQKACAILSYVFITCYFIFLSSIVNKTAIHKNAYPHAPPVIS